MRLSRLMSVCTSLLLFVALYHCGFERLFGTFRGACPCETLHCECQAPSGRSVCVGQACIQAVAPEKVSVIKPTVVGKRLPHYFVNFSSIELATSPFAVDYVSYSSFNKIFERRLKLDALVIAPNAPPTASLI